MEGTRDEIARRVDSDGRGDDLGEVLKRIADDVKTIAKDEVELVGTAVQHQAKGAMVDASVMLLGTFVALVGLGMLCMVLVAGLASVIPPLWLRLLIMSVIYIALGAVAVTSFAKRLKRDAKLNLHPAEVEAKQTVENVKRALHH